jgi:serine/threonine-protein kinase RsbW
VGAIRAAVAAFTGSDQLTDDLTCVAIEIGEQCRAFAREELEIGSDFRELRRARKFVRDFCGMPSRPWLDEERIARMELAVNEALTNIIRHAYHGRADQRIQIEAEVFSDHVTVRLHHLGVSFDPRNALPPSFDGSRESGFGIYLINSSVDHLRHYKNSRGGNCIAMVVNR